MAFHSARTASALATPPFASRIRRSTSARAEFVTKSVAILTPLLPPVAERLLRHLLQVPHLSPPTQQPRQPPNPPIFANQGRLRRPPQPLRRAKPPFAPEDHRHRLHRPRLDIEESRNSSRILLHHF